MSISTTVYTTVTVGSSAYPSPLTISSTGAVEPSSYGASGVVSALAGNYAKNYGNIDGGSGHSTLHGGDGVDLSAGSLFNEHGAYIKGGSAYAQTGHGYYYGGAGAFLAGGTLTNNGTIDGGSVFNAFSAVAGTGVDLTAGTLTNNGNINAGQNANYGVFGALVSGGSLINTGTITGDRGHYTYGGGVYLNGGALTTSGTISGGGGVAVQFGSAASTLTVEAGAVFNGNIGGFGYGDTVDITNMTPAQVSNYFSSSTYTLTTPDDGTLHFGGRFLGDYFVFSTDASGDGTDIRLAAGGQVISTDVSATVTLGTTSYPSPLVITTSGEVTPKTAGATGVVSTLAGNSLTNYGVIQGATGSHGSAGGTGGLGVNLSGGGSVLSTGSISGGAGGTGTSTGGTGGVGVSLNGGTLTTSGSISGGAGGSGPTSGAAGNALNFGTVASTLAVEPGAAFNGAIGGFGLNDTVDMTNLTPAQTSGYFNASKYTLTTPDDGTLHFAGSFAGDVFIFNVDSNGSGTDITLAAGDQVISKDVAATVTAGSSTYPSPLFITSSGKVAPTAASATGLVSTLAGNSVTNNGVIQGGTGAGGSAGATGGLGVNLSGGGSVVNTNSISGGAGGAGTSTGGHGGAGVSLNGGTLTTSGSISGGAGGSGPTSGALGAAVSFGTAASTLVVNPGAVFNGAISGFGLNDTVDITNLTPTQVAQDFNLTTDTLSTGTDGTLLFSGAFSGESFALSNDAGSGTDITLVQGSSIAALVTATVTLGSAAHPSPLTITQSGDVAPTTADATGVLSNVSTNSMTNYGAIHGGTGTSGSSGGAGGIGINLSGGTVDNSGNITGGAGGAASTQNGGAGGVGVSLNGGTLTTSGSISGGTGGAGGSGGASGAAGNAISFGTVASTLAVEAGAAFNGAIGGFGLNDTVDITNLTPAQVEQDFNLTTGMLSTGIDGTLHFSGAFSGESFAFASDGGNGTDITLVKGSSIAALVTATVTLGSSAHPSPLTITASGDVAPTTADATGVLSNISPNSMTNNGAIHGGTGTSGTTGGAGGIGVNLSAGSVLNTGSITGGTGGTGSSTGGTGGIGLSLDGGTLTTSGSISGGAGGSGPTQGVLGNAVSFGTVASTLVVDSGATFNGAISGFALNDTVDITNLTPTQVAGDFNSLTDVLSTSTDGTLTFAGAFAGESFAFSSDGASGTDITLMKGSVIASTVSSTVTLGARPYPSPLTITSAGVVAPTAAGADGVISKLSGNSLTNNGAIHGAAGSSGSAGGGGGVGAYLSATGGSQSNSGSITGGAGGAGSSSTGGAGGAGVDLLAGTLTNTAGITGGNGGTGSSGSAGGAGGNGVFLNGGTLTTSGSLSGGTGGSGGTSGAAGNAVSFGTVASTLVVESGAAFNGAISGFALNDTVDITNMTPAQVEQAFNLTTGMLSTGTDGTLHFSGAFSGESFAFASDGGSGTDITLVKGSSIAALVTATVTLGSAAHPSPLTITTSGNVAPTTANATGVLSNISGNSMTNNGAIHGGTGTSGTTGGAGGIGVNLSVGTVLNTGSISGGTGGTGSSTGGTGGIGVSLTGGVTLTTSGSISGGAGGSGPVQGVAGNAASFGAGTNTLVVESGASFNGAISGFGTSDTVDIANLTPTQVQNDYNPLTHAITTTTDGTLTFSGTFANEHFVFSPDSGSGTLVTVASGPGGTQPGASITLGRHFTHFSTPEFASRALGIMDAKSAALTHHDTLDMMRLAGAGAPANFNATHEILAIARGATPVDLGLTSASGGHHFMLTASGFNTDRTLQPSGAADFHSTHSPSLLSGLGHGPAHAAHALF